MVADAVQDDNFQGRAEKLAEELAEAEEDKAALARDNTRLAVEKASAEESLAESEDSKLAISNEIHELGTTNDRLEQELKDANDSLEEAEDDRAALSRSVEKLTSKNDRLEQELKDALEKAEKVANLSSKNDRLEQELKDAFEEAENDRATLGRNVEKLTSEKAGLRKELAGAQDILRQISTFSASIRPIATDDISQMSNADADTDTASSTGVLTPPSSTQTTPS